MAYHCAVEASVRMVVDSSYSVIYDVDDSGVTLSRVAAVIRAISHPSSVTSISLWPRAQLDRHHVTSVSRKQWEQCVCMVWPRLPPSRDAGVT